jgi:hypothetical protein
MKIKMATTAAGPEASFHSGHSYEVGKHISPEQAADFVRGRYATYETAEGEAAPETTSKSGNGAGPTDKVSILIAGPGQAIIDAVADLSEAELADAMTKEQAGKNRKGVVAAITAEQEARIKPKE